MKEYGVGVIGLRKFGKRRMIGVMGRRMKRWWKVMKSRKIGRKYGNLLSNRQTTKKKGGENDNDKIVQNQNNGKKQSTQIDKIQTINHMPNHHLSSTQQHQSKIQQVDTYIPKQNDTKIRNKSNISHQSQQPEQQLLALDNGSNCHDEQQPIWYFSDKKFRDFDLCEQTFQALQKYDYRLMTHIQARSLPHLLRGKDLLGSAKTGSGKTLAYLIPCFERLHSLEFKQINGTGVIIISPTRELAIQVFDVAKKIGEFHRKTIGLLIGGMNRKMESNRLEKGVNLLICTPGRLLDHLQNSKFNYRNLFCLVIDEADALLKVGFQQEITDILKVLPKERQTILFSATQTRRIEDIAKLSLQNPLYIGIDDMDSQATVQNLQQGFVIIAAENKFRLLITFLKKEKAKNKKVMVFFSSCNAVRFYSDLLNYVDIGVMEIHGKQKQQKRSTTFYQFSQSKAGILLCTDVAARGLDIPQVDWIIQYDPPLDIKQYIHRVGRTCRGANAKGRALLFLLEQERGYLKYLLQAKVNLNEYIFEENQLEKIQEDFQLLVGKNSYLKGEGINAFKSYLHAYTTYNIKEVFNVYALDLKAVGRSFGLVDPPRVDLSNGYGYVDLKIGGSRVRKMKSLVGR